MSYEQKVIEIVAEVLGAEKHDVTPSKRLIEDLGADSLELTELMMEIEGKFDLSVPDAEQAKLKTVKDLIDFIATVKTAH
ncbi:MAG TPA: acyl carrier protein [Chlamydiales bacterium]|nr:acyl carrier protein [Chlamydiales bacterium]